MCSNIQNCLFFRVSHSVVTPDSGFIGVYLSDFALHSVNILNIDKSSDFINQGAVRTITMFISYTEGI